MYHLEDPHTHRAYQSAFCQTFEEKTYRIWTILSKKMAQNAEKTLGVGGNSSSVWFTEASTTMSFQGGIRIQALHHLKSVSLAARLGSGSLYLALSQSGWCLYRLWECTSPALCVGTQRLGRKHFRRLLSENPSPQSSFLCL